MVSFIYDMLYIVPVSVAAMIYYCSFIGVEERTFPMYFLLLVPITFLTLFIQLKAKGRLLLFGITAIGSAGFYFAFYKFAEDFSLEESPWIIPILVISVCSFVLGMLMARVRVLRILLSVFLVVGMVLSLEVFPLPENGDKAVAAAFFVIIISVANEIHLRWKRHGDTDPKRHMVFTSPFILAIIIVASLFKYPENPYDWKAFINIWNSITVAFDKIRFGFGRGGDAMLGFSDEGDLKPSFGKGNGVTLLEISVPSEVDAPVNLTGTIYDTFDGHTWSISDTDFPNARSIDAFESFTAAKAVSEDFRDILRPVTIKVKYMHIKSKYVFAPSKSGTIAVVSKYTDLADNCGIVTFKRHNPYQFEAREVFYKLNADNPVFYDYMATPFDMNESSWNHVLPYSVWNQSANYSYEKYVEYQQKVYDLYSENITVSSELKEKLDLIYDGAETEYEKMKRLEKALVSMNYTTDTTPVPESVQNSADFLDYFLLDTKAGFCTHYATAFVLLARAEGLPARYCQGYRVAIGGAGTYTVTSDMAHAWPEVYFKGKGWVTFEPTPGYNQEISWRTVATKIQKIEPNSPPPTVFDDDEEPEIIEEVIVEEEEEKKPVNIFLILIPLGGILVFLILFTLTVRIVSRIRFSKLDKKEKLLWLSRDILSCLNLMDHRKKRSETLREYTERVASDIGDNAYKFTEIYERLLYSDLEPKSSDLNDLFDCHNEVLKNLKKYSPIRYFFKTVMSQF